MNYLHKTYFSVKFVIKSSKYCLKKHYKFKHGMSFEEKNPVTMKPQIPEIGPAKNKDRYSTN